LGLLWGVGERLQKIIEGQRAITADMALRFSLFFDMSARFWLNLQKDYELRMAERENLSEFKRVVQPYHPA
jgi:addiction module HigA family antidote